MNLHFSADILPFVQAAEKVSKTFMKTFDIQLYRCYPSIPSVAVAVAFQKYLTDVPIYIPSKQCYELIRDSTPAGQSILFTLEALKGKTKIREDEYGSNSLTCQSVFSLEYAN